MTVESKIKDAPRGAPFILFSRALVPVMYWLKWSVKWTVTRYEWSYEWSLNSSTVRLIFWVHSKASLDIPLVLINTNQLAHEWLIHTNWSITHDLFSTWVAESWIPSPINIYERVRYIRTISSTWMVESHELEHHWWLSPGLLPWVTSIIWLSNYLFSVQWITVTALTVALIVRTINFYTHFSKNTNLETDTSLPII